MTMTVAILGAGAMGSMFGARLALGGCEVMLIDVDDAHIAAVNRDGLHLHADDGDHIVPVRAGRARDFSDAVDLMFVFTKAPHTAAALESAAHLIAPSSWIVTLQNGLGTGDRIAAIRPDTRIAVGMTNWPADLKGPGRVDSHGSGEIRFWSLSGTDDPTLGDIDRALNTAGLSSRLDPLVEVAIWEKVIFNTVMNPVAALTRQTVGGMAAHPDGPRLADAVMAEAFAVAAAAGIAINPERVRASVDHAYRDHGPHRPSMLHDVLGGRATEIDAIAGALVDKAAQHGISAPVIETLARLVRMIRREA